MLIPKEYLLEEGKDAPEGTIIKKCRFCNCTYVLPAEILGTNKKINDVCDKPECKSALDKEIGNAVHLLMKASTIADASDVIKKALGN